MGSLTTTSTTTSSTSSTTPTSTTVLNVNLTSTYAEHWGVWEGVRELVQNWYDASLSTTGSLQVTKQGEAYVAPGGSRVEYEESTRILRLTNRGARISRSALLLGYSRKSTHKDVIGHFGEGLKVGALALVRRGIDVQVSGPTEQWQFRLQSISEDSTRVLVVEATPTTHDDGVMVEATGVSQEEWALAKSRFLFLTPEPLSSSYAHPAGSLLLSPERSGKLFVKGVFVTEVDDLVAGLDLFDARLDRDRAMTLRREDIEHVASAAWLGAIRHCDPTRRKALVARYFALLERTNAETFIDLRHAGFYVENDEASALAELWIASHGNKALPVSPSDGRAALDKLRKARDLESCFIPVDAGKALADVLRKTSSSSDDTLIPTLKDALARADKAMVQTTKDDDIMPLADLDSKERMVVRAASDLVDIDFVQLLDVVVDPPKGGESEKSVVWRAGRRLRVSRGALAPVARLASDGLDASLEGKTPDEARQERRRIVAKLQNNEDDAPTTCFCGTADPQRCARREKALHDEVAAIRRDKETLEAEMDILRARLQEETARSDRFQVERMNLKHRCEKDAERTIAKRFESDIAKLRRDLDSAQAQVLDYDRETRVFRQRAHDAEARLETQIKCSQRHAELVIERRGAMRDALLALKTKLENNDDLAAALDRVQTTFLPDVAVQQEDDEDQRHSRRLCAICMTNPVDILLLPCRHVAFCRDCGVALVRCPLCRHSIVNRMQVFA